VQDKSKITDTVGKITIPELFGLVKKLRLLITNDTGPLHIASAQKVKAIALFGPNTPVRFGPLSSGSLAIYEPSSCQYSPCINVHKGQVPDCLYAKNSSDYQRCMKAISVDEVRLACKKVLK